jgi:biotin transporter BioY
VSATSNIRPNRFGRIQTADLTQAAVFAGLLAALGLPGTLSIGPSGVPITLQTLGVMLAGSILGARKGALTNVLFALLAIAGLPILAGGRTGLVALSSPTAGFFVGWLPGVIVIGLLTALMMPRYRVLWGILINIVGGMGVIYLFGHPRTAAAHRPVVVGGVVHQRHLSARRHRQGRVVCGGRRPGAPRPARPHPGSAPP